MIVQRNTIHVKSGHDRQELVDLVLAEEATLEEHIEYSGPFRVYTPEYSGQPWHQVVLEWEYEDMAENERVWAEWNQLPTTPTFWEKWNELAETGAVIEIWNLSTL